MADIVSTLVWNYPWVLVISASVGCLLLIWLFPLSFEFWESDWDGILIYVAFCLSIPIFFTGTFLEYAGLTQFNTIFCCIFSLSVVVCTGYRLMYSISKNYPAYSDHLLTEPKNPK